MGKILLDLNDGEVEFSDFEEAIKVLEEYYGYDGLAWKIVVDSKSLLELHEFLCDDGVFSELV